MTSTVHVFVDHVGESVLAGTAFFARRRSLATSFTYSPGYLSDRRAYSIDPALPLQAGTHHVADLPGAFGDCSPDRWGRNLITRRLRSRAREGGGARPSPSDADFLIGVSDLSRQGALRFKAEPTGPFLDPEHRVPKLIALPQLLAAADRLSRDDEDAAALKELLDAGSGSLGGARPKASVLDVDGKLLIAKFPHASDNWDVMAWEKTALDLAARAGIRVPPARLVAVGGRQVLVLERFDRTSQSRQGYISALTLVGGRDGGEYDYEDIAETLPDHGSDVRRDLVELFRRMVFSVALHNTDDHLRNHGLLRRPGGWALSPLFDVNPNPDLRAGRRTSIAGAIRVDDEVDGLRAMTLSCRVDTRQQSDVVAEVLAGVRDWRAVAAANSIRTGELDEFADVFETQLNRLAVLATAG